MENGEKDEVSGILRTTRIIVVGLVGGVLMFGVIVVFMIGGDGPQAEDAKTMSLFLAGISITFVVARLFIPTLFVSSACRKVARGTWQPARQTHIPQPETEEGKLAQVFLTKTIIGSAILEGAAFMELIAYMLGGELYSAILAVIFTAGILAGFPTQFGFDTWLERHQRLVNEFRNMPS